jgi:hypothetical protein
MMVHRCRSVLADVRRGVCYVGRRLVVVVVGGVGVVVVVVAVAVG